MAEKSDSGEGWWGSWIQAAKNKSNDVLEFVSRDLAEFGLTVQTDTSRAVSKTSSTLKETLKAENTATATTKLKDGLSNLLGGITNALTIEPDEKDDAIVTSIQTTNLFDRSKARLHAIQVDPGTYCSSPSGPQERYQEWMETYDMESMKGNISELLVSKVEVRSLYTRLVPSKISHGEFWQHYFYKVHQLQLDEARKLAMMKRAEKVSTKDDSISWEDDWSGDEQVDEAAEERLKLPVENIEDRTVIENEDWPEQNDHEVEHTDKNTDAGDNGTGGRENDDRSSPGPQAAECTAKIDIEEMIKPDNSEVKKMAPDEGKADCSVEQPVVCAAVDSPKEDMEQPVVCAAVDSPKEDMEQPVVCAAVDSPKEDMEQPVVCAAVDSPKEDSIETESSVSSDNVKAVVEQLNIKVKGDMIVVSPDRDSLSSESSGAKEVSSVSEDWEQDFDVELTEEDLKAAEELAKKMNLSDYNTITGSLGEDWENWE